MNVVRSPGPAVEMRSVKVRIDGRVVLGPVDVTVGRGERWVVLGPNGGGKTTLLSLAGARRQPSSGRVTVLGKALGTVDVRDLHPRISHTSHILTERMSLDLSVESLVLTGKRSTLSPWFQSFDNDDRRRAQELLDRVGCLDLAERPFVTASQGERQRVLIARALFGQPELLILDEPAAGLDLPSREALIEALEQVTFETRGLTTIVATHHLEEIAPSTTHAALLREGKLVATGPVEEVLASDPLTRCFAIPVSLSRRGGRWAATARADAGARPGRRSRPR